MGTFFNGNVDCSVIVEDITLTDMTIYIGSGIDCHDTLVVEDINLRVKRSDCAEAAAGCMGYDNRRPGRSLIAGTDTLIYVCGGAMFWWRKETNSNYTAYPAIIDSVSLQKLNNILDSFEMSPASCMPKFWQDYFKRFGNINNK